VPAPDQTRGALRRRDVLIRGVGAAAAVAAGGTIAGELAGAADSASLESRDVRILNFALALERVQAGFYDEALRRANLSGALARFVRTVGAQEHEHARFLERELGNDAAKPAPIDFGGTTRDAEAVRSAAQQLEDAGTAAYIGQAANLSPAVVARVAPILSVEGRHAAWIRNLNAVLPAPRAADPGRPAPEIAALLRQLGISAGGTS
jgi:rubrerythrin